ncbi:MAG: antitoxin [Lachnospiraceae bacterium]|nr:antitoxin [Lachnospiraceae bacterium]MBR6152517.1 antitoxin [Lachnospiraceae bacterium]
MYSKASKEATMRYQKNHLDTICFRVPKGEKERYRQHAESMGTMLTPFIIQAIEEKIARDLQK